MSFFLTGTDTGVGKTHTAALVLRAARRLGVRCAGFKPICCGDRADAEILLSAGSDGPSIDEVNPVWLRTPAAPYAAALHEEREVDVHRVVEAYHELSHQYDFVVVEGVGGWLVPIRADYFVSDLAIALRLPVVVVARNRLGCINHTILTVRAVRDCGLQCAGVLLNAVEAPNDVASKTNADVLNRVLGMPLLPSLSVEEVVEPLPTEWRRLICGTV